MKEELRNLLVKGLSSLNIDIDEDKIKSFDIYLQELIKWNSKYNLTAVTDEESIISKHFLDSAVVSKMIPSKCNNIIDIGSGAGFPGIVLKILRPELAITSVDANEKKIFFQKNVMRKLNVNHIHFSANRVEDSSFIREYNNHFDCAVIRALSKLSEILTLSYPVIKKNGCIFIFKGENYKYGLKELSVSEISDRFVLEKIDPYTLPFLELKHHILVYKKK
jgi:16S rRNA (guanine527-N7)-methyltransferase